MSDARWYAVWLDPRSRLRRALQSWKYGHFQWELATDYGFLNQGTTCKFNRAEFLIFVLVFCVTWLWSWQKRYLWRIDRQSPYRANLSIIAAIQQMTYDFLLVFHCKYVSILRYFWYTTTFTLYVTACYPEKSLNIKISLTLYSDLCFLIPV